MEAVLTARGLTKRYGHTLALSEVDFDLAPGEILGYLGPNGAGKTTTLRLLMGMLKPTSGSASVLGNDVWTRSVAVRSSVGYLSGEPTLYDRLTGRDHIDYVCSLRGTRPQPSLELAEQLGLDIDKRTRALSRGNRQKLSVVLALAESPPLLLLDEPTTGLDPLAQQQFLSLVRDRARNGASVLLSSHVLSEVQQIADRVAILREGRLVTVERLEDLRAKSLHRVLATFAVAVSASDFAGVDDMRELHIGDHTLSCALPQHSLDQLLKAVAAHEVVDFECSEASLEETFLAHYGGRADSDG